MTSHPIVPNDAIVTKGQLIDMQHSDTSLTKLFELAKSEHTVTDFSYSNVRSELLA